MKQYCNANDTDIAPLACIVKFQSLAQLLCLWLDVAKCQVHTSQHDIGLVSALPETTALLVYLLSHAGPFSSYISISSLFASIARLWNCSLEIFSMTWPRNKCRAFSKLFFEFCCHFIDGCSFLINLWLFSLLNCC